MTRSSLLDSSGICSIQILLVVGGVLKLLPRDDMTRYDIQGCTFPDRL